MHRPPRPQQPVRREARQASRREVRRLGGHRHPPNDRPRMAQTWRSRQHRRRLRPLKPGHPRRGRAGRARTLVRRLRHHPARDVHGHHRPRPAPVLPLGPQRDAHRQQRKSNGRLQNRRPRRRGLRDRRGLPARNRGDLHRQRATHSQAARAGRRGLLIAGAPTDNGQPHKDAGQFWEQHDGRDYDNDKIDFHDRHKKLVAYAGRFRKSGTRLPRSRTRVPATLAAVRTTRRADPRSEVPQHRLPLPRHLGGSRSQAP